MKLGNKILLVGSPGSGKSYTAVRLGQALALPVIHLDKEYWRPNWEETPKEEWFARLEEICRQEKWILDGNYASTIELRTQAADTIIFLDINRVFCVWNVFWRHGKKRSDFPDYLQEKRNKEFLGFCGYVWNFPAKWTGKIEKLREKYPEKKFIVLKSRKEIQTFLQNIQNR